MCDSHLLQNIEHIIIKCDKLNKIKKKQKDVNIILFSLILFIIVLLLGTLGYFYLFGLSWLDSFYSATLILTAITIEFEAMTKGQKIFILIYALIAVVIFLSVANSTMNRIFDLYVNS